MRAYRVSLNGKKLCLAGIGDDGVLSTILSLATKQGDGHIHLQVAGLVSSGNDKIPSEHVGWVNQHVRVGDEIRVKIVEAKSTDNPVQRDKTNPSEDLNYQKSYVRAMGKKLGWKIQTRPRRSTT